MPHRGIDAVELDVTGWSEVGPETAGSKPSKVWLADPDDRKWLFKPVTHQVHRDGHTFPKGEDWAETVASRVASTLEIPAARAELADLSGTKGVVSLDVRGETAGDLVLGNSVLARNDPEYPASKSHGVERYTVDAIYESLRHDDVVPPAHLDVDACGAFAGYLVFDALIANTDRHHENWAVLRPADPSSPDVLAPSYDHGSSLGFQLPDTERERLVQQGELTRWAERGRSRHFRDRPSLVDLAQHACLASGATRTWLDRLAAVEEHRLATAVEAVSPARMSPSARTFVSALLITNRQRLIDALHQNAR